MHTCQLYKDSRVDLLLEVTTCLYFSGYDLMFFKEGFPSPIALKNFLFEFFYLQRLLLSSYPALHLSLLTYCEEIKHIQKDIKIHSSKQQVILIPEVNSLAD